MLSRSLVPALVGSLLLIVPAAARAQEVGIKAGINSASLTPEEDEEPDTSRRLGAVGGVWVRSALSSRLSFQLEGLFSEKGVTFNPPPGLAAANTFDVRLRYFEIPLLARGDFGGARAAANAFVVGGAAPAFKLAAHSRTVFNGQEQSRDIDEQIYSLDVGLVGGVGVAFGRALIEARYTHGLRHINTDDNGDEDRIKNRVFSVMFGFRLRR